MSAGKKATKSSISSEALEDCQGWFCLLVAEVSLRSNCRKAKERKVLKIDTKRCGFSQAKCCWTLASRACFFLVWTLLEFML